MGALAALMLWPPVSGAMLVVPLGGGDPGLIARIALAGGAVLLEAGPLPGSMIVVGDRARIATRLTSWRIIIVAAPPAGCGAGVVGRRR